MIAAAFDRAERYDEHAIVQRRVAAALGDRIAALPLARAPTVLEIGCGTGFLARAVGTRIAASDWLMTDIAPRMVERARAEFAGVPGYRFAVLDGEAPDIDARFDLICSSLAAQWFGDLAGSIRRQRALLRPGGRLAMATLAAGTFADWRAAHDAGDSGTRDYPALEALRMMGAETVADEWIEQRHADAAGFLRTLRAIGAGTPRDGHRPLDGGALRAVMRRFEAAGAVARYHVAYAVFGALP